jgi:SPP1 family predicted phage head-tail adaptor
MRTGALNTRLYIDQPSGEKLPGGQPADTWTVFEEVWGNVGGQTGLRAITDQQGDVPASVAQYSIRIRQLLGVTADMRVREKSTGTIYEIILVQHDKVKRQWTDLVCRLGANNG